MKALEFGLFGSGIILFYWMIIRPVLVKAPAFSNAFKAEASFYDKVRAKLAGLKTMLVARMTGLAGVVIGTYDYFLPFATGQDWGSITSKLPPWSLPVGLMFLGALVQWCRNATAKAPKIITQDLGDGQQKVIGIVDQSKT